MSSVLYDTPGPRAKRRNVVLSVVFFVLLALLLWWIYRTMDDKNQLTSALWKPFTESRRGPRISCPVWSTPSRRRPWPW